MEQFVAVLKIVADFLLVLSLSILNIILYSLFNYFKSSQTRFIAPTKEKYEPIPKEELESILKNYGLQLEEEVINETPKKYQTQQEEEVEPV